MGFIWRGGNRSTSRGFSPVVAATAVVKPPKPEWVMPSKSEAAKGGESGGEAIVDMRALRCRLKTAGIGTGQIRALIESSTFDLTERGFTMLIVSCRRSCKWKKALEIFATMTGAKIRGRGVRPNFYTYSSLISVCCAAGACREALTLLEEMRKLAEADAEFKPDNEVYRALVNACHEVRRHTDIMHLYNIMQKDQVANIAPETYLVVLQAAAETGCWTKGFQVLDMLNQHKIDVPNKVYNALLSTCAEKGAVQIAVEVFIGMQMAGVSPDPTGCDHMISAAVAARDTHMCCELISSMESAEIAVVPNTYNRVLGLLLENGSQKAAEDGAAGLMDGKMEQSACPAVCA